MDRETQEESWKNYVNTIRKHVVEVSCFPKALMILLEWNVHFHRATNLCGCVVLFMLLAVNPTSQQWEGKLMQ